MRNKSIDFYLPLTELIVLCKDVFGDRCDVKAVFTEKLAPPEEGSPKQKVQEIYDQVEAEAEDQESRPRYDVERPEHLFFTIKSRLYGFNGNMHDWHVIPEEGGGMPYDWGVHLLDQILWMMPGVKLNSVFADIRNVINEKVDDYFKILMRFENGVTAEVELGTYYLADKMHDKWFERHWFLGGNKGSAYVDGFEPEGKIVRTAGLLQNASGQRTMTAAGPTRSFGPPPDGKILTEELPLAHTNHRQYFENYIRAYQGQEEFLVKIPETRRVLRLMDGMLS